MKFVVRPLKLLSRFLNCNNFKGNDMLNINKQWKYLHNTKTLQSKHVIQRAVLRAMEKTDDANKAIDIIFRDLIKSFAPRTNKNARDNGYGSLQAIHQALKDALIDSGLMQQVLGVSINKLGDFKEAKYLKFLRTFSAHRIDEYYNRHYVYIFVRQDIFPEYQLVQAAHVALKIGWFIRNEDMGSNPSELYFTVIGVKDLDALRNVANHLNKRHISWEWFHEPDINEPTAIATYPIPIRERGDLLQYKLLRFNRVVD